MANRRRPERQALPKSGKSLNKKLGVGSKNAKKLRKNKLNKKRNNKRMQKYKKTAYRHHQKNSTSKKERKSFKHKSVCQLILLSVHAYDKPCSFSQVRKLLIEKCKFQKLTDLQIKKGIKDLVSMGCLKDTSKQNSSNSDVIHKYIYTKKHLPKNKTLKRKRMTMRTSKNDKYLRMKMRRMARKTNRGGRTYEQVVKDYLDLKQCESGKYFQSIKYYLKKHNMKCSSFVLKKVLQRLRSKGVIKTSVFVNTVTGKDIPKPKSMPVGLKEKNEKM